MTIKRRKTVRTTAPGKRRLRAGEPKVVRTRSSDAGEITAKPTLLGYARVSTVDQNLALQRDALAEAGCARIFTEQMSGAVKDRPALHDALEFARRKSITCRRRKFATEPSEWLQSLSFHFLLHRRQPLVPLADPFTLGVATPLEGLLSHPN
jgi:hypothetical protein